MNSYVVKYWIFRFDFLHFLKTTLHDLNRLSLYMIYHYHFFYRCISRRQTNAFSQNNKVPIVALWNKKKVTGTPSICFSNELKLIQLALVTWYIHLSSKCREESRFQQQQLCCTQWKKKSRTNFNFLCPRERLQSWYENQNKHDVLHQFASNKSLISMFMWKFSPYSALQIFSTQ